MLFVLIMSIYNSQNIIICKFSLAVTVATRESLISHAMDDPNMQGYEGHDGRQGERGPPGNKVCKCVPVAHS